MMIKDPSTLLCTALTVILALCIKLFFFRRASSRNNHENEIPLAPGAVPLIGHALLYKKNAPKFLNGAVEQVGPIFRINLAGKQMIIVGRDCPALKQIASAPESMCSARDAIASVGFEQTLGLMNVNVGTDIHKRILKGALFSASKFRAEIPKLYQALDHAFSKELDTSGEINVEFFSAIRRIILRASIDRLIGSRFLQQQCASTFLSDFMEFQDALEDATAKGAILPRWIALPTFLWPVEKRRLILQQQIVFILSKVLNDSTASRNDGSIGLWLEEVQKDHPVKAIAELMVGLLFAVHKNPAIGAAQAYLFLEEHCTPDDLATCQLEANMFSASPTIENLQQACTRLHRVCLETLRLTAHSIGGLRTARRDFILEGTKYAVRKGESIGISHIAPNWDDKVWENATKLNTTVHGDALYNDEYKFTTFSQGIHRCPGQALAVALMKCTLTVLLTKYTIQVEQLPPISFERATLAQREGAVFVSMKLKDCTIK